MEIKVGHQCPHCHEGIVLTLDVIIAHASGSVAKARKEEPVKVEATEVGESNTGTVI